MYTHTCCVKVAERRNSLVTIITVVLPLAVPCLQ
jgi:hypothetical protein